MALAALRIAQDDPHAASVALAPILSSAAHRRSYARRTGAERGFATAKDPATNDISRGWCRLMGLAPPMLFTTTLLIVRNQRILDAWNVRHEDNARRAAAWLPPKSRRRRRTALQDLVAKPP